MARKKRTAKLMPFFPIILCYWVIIPKSVVWMGVYAPLLVTYVGFMLRAHIKDDKEAEVERQKELSRQRTAELESELGIEPLNLYELDPIFEEIEREKRERGDM